MKFYKATYKSYLIGISEKEKYVRKYAENIRCIDPKDPDYSFEEVDMTYEEIMNNDFECRIVEKYGKGIYFTYQDIFLLDRQAARFLSLYDNTIRNLQELAYYSGKIPTNKALTTRFKELQSIMIDYNTDFQRSKFKSAVQNNSPIFSEDINEYIFNVFSSDELIG